MTGSESSQGNWVEWGGWIQAGVLDSPHSTQPLPGTAVRAALNGLRRLILEDYMQGCMVKAAQDGDFDDAFRDLKKSLDQFID